MPCNAAAIGFAAIEGRISHIDCGALRRHDGATAARVADAVIVLESAQLNVEPHAAGDVNGARGRRTVEREGATDDGDGHTQRVANPQRAAAACAYGVDASYEAQRRAGGQGRNHGDCVVRRRAVAHEHARDAKRHDRAAHRAVAINAVVQQIAVVQHQRARRKRRHGSSAALAGVACQVGPQQDQILLAVIERGVRDGAAMRRGGCVVG